MRLYADDIDLRNRLMIALAVIIHPANRFVIARDDRRHMALWHNIEPVANNPGASREMRLMRPLLARQAARQQSLADMDYRRRVIEQADFEFGHFQAFSVARNVRAIMRL